MDVDKENLRRSDDDDVDTQFGCGPPKLANSRSGSLGDRAPFTTLPANSLSSGSSALTCTSCDAFRNRATRAEARTGDTLEKLREAQDEVAELRRAQFLAEETAAAAERAKSTLSQKAHEECMIAEEERNMLKRAERRWQEEVCTLQTFCSGAQQLRAEARQQRDAIEEVSASAQLESQELDRLRAIHRHSLEEHLSERRRWQEEVASMAADFRDLRQLAANAARLPATLHMVEERAAEQSQHLHTCEDELKRLHEERAHGLEAEGELRVARLQAAQRSQEWCEASAVHESRLRLEEAKAERLESQLAKLEFELETTSRSSSSAPRPGSRRARWQRSYGGVATPGAVSVDEDEHGSLGAQNFKTAPMFPLRHRSGQGVSNVLDISFGSESMGASSMSCEYEPRAWHGREGKRRNSDFPRFE